MYKTHSPALEPTQRLGQRVQGNKADRPRMREALLQYVPSWLSYVKSSAYTSNTYIQKFHNVGYIRGHGVTQLVVALCYKPEGRGFDFRWGHWDFLLTSTFRSQYGAGVNSVSNRHE